MNIKLVANYLGKIMILCAACMVVPLLIALCLGEWAACQGFAVALLSQALCGALCLLIRAKDKEMYAREGFVIAALSWIGISLFGAIPFVISGSLPHYHDALFEVISGFTTTGSTVFTEVESLARSVLYWRSFTHWIGGMGVLVFILALAPGKSQGMPLHILRAESPGPTVGKIAPKLYNTARILYVIYLAMTAIETVVLLCSGMTFFESITTSFSTAGTGGFAVKNDGFASHTPFQQVTVGIFMMLFGVNFNCYFYILIGQWRAALKNTEVRVYFLIIAIATTLITLSTKMAGCFGSWGDATRHSFFQVSSIITTTGMATTDFNLWPTFAQGVLLMVMAIGSCAGSTGGGLKVSRLLILCKATRAEVKKMMCPRSVQVITMDGKPVEKETVSRCFTFLLVYVVIFALSVLILTLDGSAAQATAEAAMAQGIDSASAQTLVDGVAQSHTTSFTAVLTCLNNVGPGLGKLIGPMGNFSSLSALSKFVLMGDMLLGRLELFPLIITFMPSTWRRKRY